MSTGTATKTPGIDGGPMGRFEVANCLVPKRLTALIEKFLRDQLTGNIQPISRTAKSSVHTSRSLFPSSPLPVTEHDGVRTD